MSALTRPVRVFVSSPGNLQSERLLVVTICRELSTSMGVPVEPLLWEGGGPQNPDVPAFPAEMIGEGGAQAVIDRRLWDELGGYDVYVGMIWHRMGTPIKTPEREYRSGTEAEYRSAQRWKQETGRPSTILFYEKNVLTGQTRDIDPEQLAMVRAFTSELEDDGLLHRFSDEGSLRKLLIPDLTNAVNRARSASAEAGRLALLEEIERESRGRCVARWLVTGLSPTEAHQLAQDPSVGAPSPELRARLDRPLVMLTAELGAGKSLIIERLLQEAIAIAREDTDAPIPIYIEARRIGEGRLREVVEEEAGDLGEPRRQGSKVFIDGAEAGDVGRAATLLNEARALTQRWPETSIIIASRPVPHFSSTEESIPIPQLSEEEAHGIIGRISGRLVTAAVSYNWSPSIKDAIKRPLFAVLLGVYEREAETRMPRSRGELLSSLVDRTLERAGGNISVNQAKLERLAASSTDRSGGLVPRTEIAWGAELHLLRHSGLVVEHSGLLGFPLPILTEWFAAHSLVSGYPNPDDLAVDQQRLELWRYSLVIAVGYFGNEHVTKLLGPIAKQHPAFAAQIVNEGLARWGPAEDMPPPPPLECGRQLHAAMKAWVEGIGGPLARLIAPVREDGTLGAVGVNTASTPVRVGWYRGNDNLGDVVRVPPGTLSDRSSNWYDWGVLQTGHQPAWAWMWTLKELSSPLIRLMKRRALPIDGGMLAQEAAWRAALFLTRSGSLRHRPIPLAEIEGSLSLVAGHVCIPGRVVGQQHDLRYLRKELNRLRTVGVSEMHPPWPGPDRALGGSGAGGGWLWAYYTDEQLLARATVVYEGALDGYRRLVERWFSRLAPRLQTAATLPARLTGIVVRRDRQGTLGQEVEGSDNTPIIGGYLEALPHDRESVVDLRFSEDPSDLDEMRESWQLYIMPRLQAVRPEASPWLGSTFEGSILDVFNSNSATELAYGWLWRDLRRVSWVRGMLPHRY